MLRKNLTINIMVAENKIGIGYYGLWEEINNPNFNSVKFHVIKTEEAPYNRFTMTPVLNVALFGMTAKVWMR